MLKTLGLVDYGIGNLGSIEKMVRYLGHGIERVSTSEQISAASGLILPGVGAFDRAMSRLEELDLLRPLHEAVLEKQVPVLGVCLGMQLLGMGSEEGSKPGLGWIRMNARRFRPRADERLKVPHMGWNRVSLRKSHPLFDRMPEPARFYFVHSYYLECENEADVLTETSYGVTFVSSVARNNVFGVQYHPEKSHKFGIHLFRNFIEKV